MAKSIYLVTVGVNEELARVRSNRFLIELVCEAHECFAASNRSARVEHTLQRVVTPVLAWKLWGRAYLLFVKDSRRDSTQSRRS